MTNEEIKNKLQRGLALTVKESWDLYKYIEALEQQPCEDAVSRQKAIEAVMDLCKYYTPTKSVNHPHMDFVIEALQDLPPVTPTRPKGEWIDTENKEEWYAYEKKCSICGHLTLDYGNYCSSCGADMRRGDADDED